MQQWFDMESHHIQELRAAFDRALSELAAVAESEILPYEVRAAAMQAHISIAAKANETIAHLLSMTMPSGVTGTRVKVADLIETIGRAAQRAGNATVIGNMGEFKSVPDERTGKAKDEGALTTALIEGARRAQEHNDALVVSLHVGESKMVCGPDNTIPIEGGTMRIRGLVKDDATEGIEVLDSTTVKVVPQHTERFTNAAMPAGATVTDKWDKG